MKDANFYRKPISMFVMVAFTTLLFLWASQSPAASSPPASGNKTATSLEKGGSEGTGFFEQEISKPVVKKHKKFPWPIFLIVGAIVVFLVIIVNSLDIHGRPILRGN